MNSSLRTSSLLMILARAGAAAGLTASMLVAGCDNSDSVQDALDLASRRLNAIATGGSAPQPGDEQRTKVYNTVITELRSPADSTRSPGQAAAANLLIARGQAGLGEVGLAKAVELEADALNQIVTVRAKFGQYLSQHSLAAALASYDPTNDIAAIDAEMAKRRADAAKAQTDLAAQQKVVSDLEQKAAEAGARAKTERDQEGAIRAQAISGSQTQRAELIKSANEARRRADEHDQVMSNILSEAARERPKLVELQSRIDRLSKQQELFEQSKKELRDRAEQSRSLATEARGAADKAGQEIQQAVTDLSKARDTANSACDDVAKHYKDAAASASKGGVNVGREGKALASVSGGNYQQGLGDALATKAMGLAQQASLLDALSKAQPPLPGHASIVAAAKATNEALSEARTKAQEAYTQAKSKYESAGASGELKERLDALAASIQRLIEGTTPAAAPAAETPAPSETPAAEKPAEPTTSATPMADYSAEEAGVRAMIERMIAAAKAQDKTAMLANMDVKDPAVRAMIETGMEGAWKLRAFDEACRGAFGKTFGELVQESQQESVKQSSLLMMAPRVMAQLGGPAEQVASSSSSEFSVSVLSPTEAEFSRDATPGTLKAVKVGDEWKFEVALPAGPAAAQIGMMLKPIQAMGRAMDKTAGRIKAGEFKDGDSMLLALNAELLGQLNAGGGDGGGGGGGGG